MSDAQVEIKVMVPAQRLAEFYRMFGTWLDGDTAPAEERGWRNGTPWTTDDAADARRFLRSVSTTARRILLLWAQADGDWVTGDETAREVGVQGARGVAGSLSSVGVAADKLGRALPFEHEVTDGLGRYRMEPAIASLFRSAEGAGR